MFSPSLALRRLITVLIAGACFVAPVAAQTFTRASTTFPSSGVLTPTTSVAFGNGTFVALGLKGRPAAASASSISAYTSTDGSTWTERVINIPDVSLNNHGVVRYLGSQFVFTGRTLNASYVARSSDGASWTISYPENLSPLNGFAEIVVGNGTAVGFFATTLGSSTDGGATWTARAAAGVASTVPYYELTYGAGRFVLTATGTATKVWTSPDAANWTEILAGQQNSGRIAYGNGIFVLTGTNYKTSTDGVTFTTRTTPTGFSLTGTNLLRFLGGRFIYSQFGFNSSFQLVPELFASPDGLLWTRLAGYETALAAMTILEFAEGNNRLVAVGSLNTGTAFSPQNSAVVAVLDTTNLPALPSAPAAPVITTQPVAQNAVAGGSVSFTVAVSGTGNTYQWRKDNVAITGATTATYTITSVAASNAGSYTVVVTNSVGSTTSSAATLTLINAADVSRLSNLAVRTTLTANQVLTVGFTMSGGSKNLLLRAAGPGLAALGVPGTMADPKLALFNGSTQITSNDNWAGNAAVSSAIAAVGAFPFPGATSLDAALVASVEGGRSIQVSGPAAGNVIVEAYDAGSGNTPRLTNLSALNHVGTGGDILIAGFTIAGATTKNLLIRAVGPGLAALGVGGTLADPKVELYNSAQTKIDQNDTWSSTLAATFVSVGAFGLPAGSKDAALIVSLPPGGYTVQVSGADGGTGSAIIEVYELP